MSFHMGYQEKAWLGFRVSLRSQMIQSTNVLHRCAQLHASQFILDVVKISIKINHHIWFLGSVTSYSLLVLPTILR